MSPHTQRATEMSFSDLRNADFRTQVWACDTALAPQFLTSRSDQLVPLEEITWVPGLSLGCRNDAEKACRSSFLGTRSEGPVVRTGLPPGCLWLSPCPTPGTPSVSPCDLVHSLSSFAVSPCLPAHLSGRGSHTCSLHPRLGHLEHNPLILLHGPLSHESV